jgi:hypothetical protein
MDVRAPSGPTGITAAVVGVLAVLLVLIVVLDVGPCAEERLSEEEFIAKGDELCREAHAEFEDLQRGTPPRTPSDAEELTGALIEVAEEERDAIDDLAEPESLTERVDRYLGARERGIDLLEDGLGAAEDGDAAAYEAAQAELASSQLDPRYDIARAIGFSECSKPLLDRDELERQSEPPEITDVNAPPEINNPPTEAP